MHRKPILAASMMILSLAAWTAPVAAVEVPPHFLSSDGTEACSDVPVVAGVPELYVVSGTWEYGGATGDAVYREDGLAFQDGVGLLVNGVKPSYVNSAENDAHTYFFFFISSSSTICFKMGDLNYSDNGSSDIVVAGMA